MEFVINKYDHRNQVITALTEAGYGVRVEERRHKNAHYSSGFVVVILSTPKLPEWMDEDIVENEILTGKEGQDIKQ